METENYSSVKKFEFLAVIFLILVLCFTILIASATVAFAVRRSVAPANSQPVAVNSAPGPQSSAADSLKTFHGMLTDSICGARHARNSNRSSSECTRSCIHHGGGHVLINSEGRYRLRGNRAELNSFAGQRVTVVGELDGGSIGMRSIRAGD